MHEKRIPKRVLKSEFTGKKPVGKSRRRWVNAVEIDSRVILKVRTWRRESLVWQVWKRHLKEVKDRFRTVVSQRKRKRKKNYILL
jgi:cell division protein FtsB